MPTSGQCADIKTAENALNDGSVLMVWTKALLQNCNLDVTATLMNNPMESIHMINKTLSISHISFHTEVLKICFAVIIIGVYYSKLLVMLIVRELNTDLCLSIAHILVS